MITSALIAQCRREFSDEPKSVSVSRQGNGNVNLFNVGPRFPVLENSYTIYVSGLAKTETTDYTYDLDNGDLRILVTPQNGMTVRSQHKYAIWRDAGWNQAINGAIDDLNARGFFRQITREAFNISANVTSVNGPTNCIDLYELLVSSTNNTSGTYNKPNVNWSYQQDANKLIIGNKSTTLQYAKRSYLRNLQTYNATSATLDLLPDWLIMIKKKAGADFYRMLAGKIAKEGNATIDEGHFSFTNLRAQANDLQNEYERLALRKKPTRPAKDLSYHLSNGGVAG